MPATKVPVVYSLSTGRIRWFVLFDDINETDAHVQAIVPGHGEGVLLIDRNQAGPLEDMQTLISKTTKLTPTDDRYVVLDQQGNVKGAVILDPMIDVIDASYIKHAQAGPEWKLVNGELQAPPATIVDAAKQAALIEWSNDTTKPLPAILAADEIVDP